MGQADYFKHGDRNAICDQCGFKYKLSQLRKRWDGLMVCSKDWSTEPPSNYWIIRAEKERVLNDRPEQTDVYVVEGDIDAIKSQY